MAKKVTTSITAQNTFTDSLFLLPNVRVSVSISGTFNATVTIQRRLDGTNWRDVESWTGEIETDYISGYQQDVRIGVKTGDFTSGTAVLYIGIG
ncbi:hypothetical protein LCGC14_2831750 [marine sediment metagenome]|uniref:Uncharacterized protein n=1 Tax=marine sediment metagenome TaxID=412755 RepID=A0A0F9B4T6_9ZZZZ